MIGNGIRTAVTRRLGIVRLRQWADAIRHQLSFVPAVYVIAGAVLVELSLAVDRRMPTDDLPDLVTTTSTSARAVFSTIAGGLITAITLLLSMMLVTVQLASSQFSPRTLRDWLGDRLVQHTVGLALGTTVFALLALRSTGSDGEPGGVVPHATVLGVVVAAVVALFMLVRSVDHTTHSVRVGAVADRIARDTIRAVESSRRPRAGEDPGAAPAVRPSMHVVASRPHHAPLEVPDDAVPIESVRAGWVQQIDDETLLEALPEGSTGWVAVPIGGYVDEHTPLVWVTPPPSDHEACTASLLEAFAVGDSRTLQQDVAFGLVQLTDIGVRALSPGVNDPTTASDVIVHLGRVLTHVWSTQEDDAIRSDGDRTIVRRRPTHGEHLRSAFDPLRRHAVADPAVSTTLVRTLQTLRRETRRRRLPGPIEPIDEMIREIVGSVRREAWSDGEQQEFDAAASTAGRVCPA